MVTDFIYLIIYFNFVLFLNLGWGTHVYLWRIHFDIWQNLCSFKNFDRYCQITLQKTMQIKISANAHK